MKQYQIPLLSVFLLLTACAAPTPQAQLSTNLPSPTDPPLLPAATPQAPTEVSKPTVTATEYVPSHPVILTDSLQPGQTAYAFLSSTGVEVRYLIYLPEKYDPDKEWPLIVFLAGSDGRGSNIDRLINLPPHNYVEDLADFPFIIVTPQLADGFWPKLIDPIDELLDHLIKVLPIDANRLYLTGYSLGGNGTWKYALKYPDRFAAIAPIAGGPSVSTDRVPEDICTLKELPIWAIHGAEDTGVPPEQSIEPVDALEACGADVKLTLYPDTGHDAWTPTYSDLAFYEWLLAQSK